MTISISAGKPPKAAAASEEADVVATESLKRLRKRAAAAAATLLSAAPAAQAAKAAAPPTPLSPADHWTWDTSFMQYSESERITVYEPQVGVRHDYVDGQALSILATVDTIS